MMIYARAIGFNVDVSNVLPDLILAELGEEHPIIIFVECVASDGPIKRSQKTGVPCNGSCGKLL